MVHLLHTPLQLTAVVGPVQLPVAAGTAPAWAPVRFADKDILAVKSLQPRAIWVVVRPWLIPASGFEVSITPATALRLCLLLLCPGAQRSDTRVELNDQKDSKVRN